MKLKKILEEAFEGLGGVVPLGAIHNLDGFSNKKFVDNTVVKEGPAYEYEKMVKSIEKSENKQAKEVNNLVKTLQKKGFKKEATNVANAYMKSMRAFNNELDDIIRGLM
tara:strand:+ start:468 stop:794 length:327 start_codon:yes stop_codon:yes gene_type:complete